MRRWFIAGSIALLVVALGTWRLYSVRDDEAFARDDAARLTEDALGLRSAYETLKQQGHRVALLPVGSDHAPNPRFAWWILQAGPGWFADGDARSRELLRFFERGGTAVLIPEEAVTPILGDDATEESVDLSAFFTHLGLDVRILAFEPQLDEDEEQPELHPEDGAYTLAVSGNGDAFSQVATLETSWGNYFDGESLLKADIRLHADGFPLVAEFPIGRGKLVLVAESTYFENEFIDRAENRSLLLALASAYAAAGIQFHPAR